MQLMFTMTRKRQRGIFMVDRLRMDSQFKSFPERLTRGATSRPQLHSTPPSTGNAIGVPSRPLANRLTRSATSQAQLHPTPPSIGNTTRGTTSQLQLNHTLSSTENMSGGLSRSLYDAEQLIHDNLGRLRAATSQSQFQPTPPPTENMTGNSNNIRRGRGVARFLPSWGMGQKLDVEFNQFMQPVGPNSSKLLSQLGCIARDGERVPLTYAKWTDMPNHVLEDIWLDVRDNTNVPDGYKDYCLRKVSSLWRSWKFRLKEKYYYKNRSNPEKLAEVPNKVVPDQWPTLVRFWSTEDVELLVQKNKANRSLQGLIHRTGRKSFANIRMKMEKNGEHTDRDTVFIKSRRNKKGETDEETASVLNKLEERLSEVPESEQTFECREKIFTDIIGDGGHGQVRTCGFGPSHADVFGRQATRKGPSDEDLTNLRQQIREEVLDEVQSQLKHDMEVWIQEQVDALRAQIMADVTARFNLPYVVTSPPSSGQVPEYTPHVC